MTAVSGLGFKMTVEILLKGEIFPRDTDSRKRINDILKKEGIKDFTYYYQEERFEINEFIKINNNFSSNLYLKNLMGKLKPNVKEGNNFLGIYYLKNKIEF